ncbi:50S ribosomal protein L13 [Halobacteriovorax marinus]|uniref:Large ribosomal subunit protein uL13 n=1 Tax=Halobacteriovorax marinus TaxID=97084 RepID=A0A1Y5F1Q9_9BACT|nr:50S ribosomal protein L13 [Halobacteriovorax marinus]
MYTQKSFVLKPADTDKKWHLIDANDKVVGRLATEIANILRGKNSPKYTPHTDSGDFVVVINAEKVKFTGSKWDKKLYIWHTNHIGGLKSRTAKEQLERKPEQILMSAVKGMLPKNSLGRKQLTKLKVFAGEAHSHEAQQPAAYAIK